MQFDGRRCRVCDGLIDVFENQGDDVHDDCRYLEDEE